MSLYSLANTASRVKIANGSASLGRVASVDVFGENVFVVWEFGRVGVFEIARGRVTEVGELKTSIGSLKSAWGIRRVKGRAEGVFSFMLSQAYTESAANNHSTCHVVSQFGNRRVVLDIGSVDHTFYDHKHTDNRCSVISLEPVRQMAEHTRHTIECTKLCRAHIYCRWQLLSQLSSCKFCTH